MMIIQREPPEPPSTPGMTPAPTVAELRHEEYMKPGGAFDLLMRWQAGEGTEQAWLAERERVQQLYQEES